MAQKTSQAIQEVVDDDGIYLGHRDEFARLARRDLTAFSLLMDSDYEPSLFHRVLAKILTECAIERKYKRVIINCPPRHGKSRAVSCDLPSLCLGINPKDQIVLASYGQTLSLKASKEVRRRFQSPVYRQLFPDSVIRQDERGGQLWATTKGGGVQAVGVGSGLSGHGADIMIIDDVHKDRAEAESPTRRENVWDWWVSTASTRMSPNGVVIVLMTRWHKDDLAGRLMDPEYQAEQYRAVVEDGAEDERFVCFNFPAEAVDEENDLLKRKKGDALWPERWSRAYLRGKRTSLGSYEYNALYQGDPQDRTGNEEVVNRIRYCDLKDVPEDLSPVRGWDTAVTDNRNSDYSAGALGGFHHESGNMYILDICHMKSRWLGVKEAVLNRLDKEQNIAIIEAVSQAQGLVDEAKLEKNKRGIAGVIKMQIPKRDKVIRAIGWISLAEQGKLFLVRGDWNDAFINELRTFPSGDHDDQIDAVSIVFDETNKKKRLLYG